MVVRLLREKRSQSVELYQTSHGLQSVPRIHTSRPSSSVLFCTLGVARANARFEGKGAIGLYGAASMSEQKWILWSHPCERCISLIQAASVIAGEQQFTTAEKAWLGEMRLFGQNPAPLSDEKFADRRSSHHHQRFSLRLHHHEFWSKIHLQFQHRIWGLEKKNAISTYFLRTGFL